ncbi:MAG: GNAT family N-acetyltransferase [Nitrospinae bacterium]|nr:GNAT family N-acetyltransferase [Nitrospinota bacterium]
MDIQKLYKSKVVTPKKAIKNIKSGRRVFVGTGCSEPQLLVKALCDEAENLDDIEIVHLLTLGIADYVNNNFMENFRHNAFFIGPNVRKAVSEGRADYTPIFLSEIPFLITSGQRPVDVALLQLSPPDKHGYCSMGMNVDIQKAAYQKAEIVIAEINPKVPRTFGDSVIHLNDIHCCVESDFPLLELPIEQPDEIAERIGGFIARLIENGSCLQAGIGAIPAAVLRALTDKRDLGVHTEMFTDDMLALLENGNITNKHKNVHPGKTLTSFVMGTQKLFNYIDDNPSVVFYPSDYVNDPRIIARNDNVVAINSALQVDLTGQVCADSMGYKFYSGIGGQVDFIRGAALSKGGKPIIAFPSTAKQGTISRIVASLDEGAGVVTSRGDVHYIVTEYGVAYLHGKTIRERALALINIAHPDFRQDLLNFVKKKHYVYEDEKVWQQASNPYPVELEARLHFGEVKSLVRPLRATDERALQEFFYSHGAETIYYRHFTSKKKMSRQEAAELCCVDYGTNMAIAAFDKREKGEKIIAVARYTLNPVKNMAETAVVVHEKFRRKGIAQYLLTKLQDYAKSKGIAGFYSEIIPENVPMLELRKKLNSHVRWIPDEGVYASEIFFNAE